MKKLFNISIRTMLIFLLGITTLSVNRLYANSAEVEMEQKQRVKISGNVVDSEGEPLIGAAVTLLDGSVGAITDVDGNFTITVPADAEIVVSYVGYEDQQFNISSRTHINVVMAGNEESIDEVVVVGYGVQTKASVVGAISQVSGDELLKSGGVTNVSEALQGKVPGVVTMYTSGEPGNDDVQIYIRGQSSWNSTGSPLVLVDGVERSLNDVDMNEIASMSILKDASATAVYGVKGANGVILLTTKRGDLGKTQLSVTANISMKSISKVPEKYDAYDAMMAMNDAVMAELMYSPDSWNYITPVDEALKYRNQVTAEDYEMYPNVDWEDYMFKDFATDTQVAVSVSGGTDIAKYFCNISYLNETDITKDFDNGRGYDGGTDFQKFTYRSNLDFNLSPTTKLGVNISGLYSIKNTNNASDDSDERMFLSLYNLAPDLYLPIYSDGSYGFSPTSDYGTSNSLMWYTATGQKKTYNFKINVDLNLEQDLSFVAKGLTFKARFTMDNGMSGSQSITDMTSNTSNAVQKYYDHDLGGFVYSYPQSTSEYEYSPAAWTINDFTVGDSKSRRTDYQMSLDYNTIINDKHAITALGLFKRQQYAVGDMLPYYYEDWVARATYSYDNRYLIEVNGAYNGSEKFGVNYRFDLFPSVAGGWIVSNESFLKDVQWIDRIKLRGSIGLVGDDNFTTDRWLYMNQWASVTDSSGDAFHVANNVPGYFAASGTDSAESAYDAYYEALLGNEDVHWETSLKKDLGLEFSFLNGMFSGEVDYFEEYRSDIYIDGDDRALPDFFGTSPVGANVGEVEVKGYEFTANFMKRFQNGLYLSANYSFSHSKDVVIYAEDPELTPFYQKTEGYSIGQTTSAIAGNMMESWDDIYMSTPLSSGDSYKRTGYYDLIDFNGDGMYYGTDDNAPYGYANRPQNTWSLNLGAGYKGWDVMIQFYGQYNTTRSYTLNSFPLYTHLFFEANGDYWTTNNTDGTQTISSLNVSSATSDPYSTLIDASMTRLKMVEVSYTVPTKVCKSIGVESLRLYVNGNNLYLWTDMADDRDYGSGNRGEYPTFKRFNFGVNLTL